MTDDEFLLAFHSGSLPLAQWSHRAHVRVTFLHLSRFLLDEAIDRMRSGIRTYNAAHGVEDRPESGYHETTTLAFMRLIYLAMQARGPFRNSDHFCERSPELLDRRVLLCYYTRDRLMAPEAKSGFVDPDIAPLERMGLAYPEFGTRLAGADYTLRPGSYGVILNEMGRVAVVVTPTGAFLPGGGQEPGESAIAALYREVHEECGLTVRIEAPLGVADEFVFAEQERQYFCKRCSFYAAAVVASGESGEADHQLAWLDSDKAIEQLSHGSQRWAVRCSRSE